MLFRSLTLTNVREAIVNAIPNTLKNAIGAGIDLFIAFIGLENAGIIVNSDATLVTLDITSNSALLCVIGLIITGVMVIMKVKGAILFGIILTAIIGVPMGLTSFNGIVSQAPSIAPIFCQFEWNHIFTLDMVIVVFTFLFIDMFDTIGTVVGVSKKANMMNPDGSIQIGRAHV